MKDITKMMLFMFLGLIAAIVVLGFHKSPTKPPLLTRPATTPSTSSGTSTSRSPYDTKGYD